MKPVVRLQGEDTDVREIGQAAVNAMEVRPQAASALFARLWSIHQRRRSAVSAMSAQQPASATPPVLRETGSALRAVWGTLLGIGLTAALVSAVMFGPSDRKNAFLNPELAGTVALVAGAIAVPALMIVLLLRVPDHQSARVGETLSVLVGLVCVGMLVFRLAAGSADERGFSSEAIAWWVPMTAVIELLIIGLAVRSDGVRRGPADPADRAAKRSGADDRHQMRRDAEWASSMKSEPAVATAWTAGLDDLRERVDPDALAQARAMTPAAWLAWMSYDGEIDISGVVPRR